MLGNPPVIQTWIGFKFEAASLDRVWDVRLANEFLSRFAPSFPHRRAFYETEFEIQDFSPNQHPRVVNQNTRLNKVIARDETGERWLQLTNGQLVCNRVRADGPYPGFTSLRDESLEKLAEYVDFFQPSNLLAAEVHYVDVIEVPIPPEGRIELKDYFKLYVEVPEVYGDIHDFSTRLFLRTPSDGDILEVKFESKPPSPDASAFRFRLDWHMVCKEIASFDRDVVSGRLDRAHEFLLKYFKATVTERTWVLFGPSEEG
jgi:uncharacterized protein (TIGR04255 family)